MKRILLFGEDNIARVSLTNSGEYERCLTGDERTRDVDVDLHLV